jgi:hypothetical protein
MAVIVWCVVKELEVLSFDECKADLPTIDEGLWKSDVDRGGRTTIDGVPTPWRRWVMQKGDEEPIRIRAVLLKEGKYSIQKGTPELAEDA